MGNKKAAFVKAAVGETRSADEVSGRFKFETKEFAIKLNPIVNTITVLDSRRSANKKEK